MPQYLTPGVYMEEIPGAKPIEGVGTATGAFVGIAEKGPIGEARLITNMTQYFETFGGYISYGYLTHAVQQFFSEGGTKCYVVRTCHYDYSIPLPAPHMADVGDITLQDPSSANTLLVEALTPGSWSDHIWIEVAQARKDPGNKFRIVVWHKDNELEQFEELTKNDVADKVNGKSKFIKISHDGTSVNAPKGSACIINDQNNPAEPTLGITALQSDLIVAVAQQQSSKFELIVLQAGKEVERKSNLSMIDVEGKVTGVSPFIKAMNMNPVNNRPPRPTVTVLNDRFPGNPTLEVTNKTTGTALTLDVADDNITGDLTITVTDGTTTETYSGPSLEDIVTDINANSSLISVKDLGSPTAAPANRPAATTVSTSIAGGATVILNDRTVRPTLEIIALAAGVSLAVTDNANGNLDITVSDGTPITYSQPTLEDIVTDINGNSTLITVRNLGSPTAAPANRPDIAATAALSNPHTLDFFALRGGDDGLADGVTLKDSGNADSLKVNAFRDDVAVTVEDATSGPDKFKVIVLVDSSQVEIFDELIIETVDMEINGASQFIEVEATAGANRPENISAQPVPLGLADMDFVGDALTKNGLHAFDPVDDINIVAIPDWPGDREVILEALTYCQNRRDCFFVADAPAGLEPMEALDFKQGTGVFAGNAFNSSYGALYYPWILKGDPLTGANKLVPPSGAVAGTYSGTDVIRGVHKAPAGTIDGYLNSSVGIERIVTKGEQELLNPEHVNVIRKFPAAGIVIWGARTLSADPEFRYINVRRLLLFIEESIEKGSQWVVFEPNNRSLWATVKRDVTAFLSIVWKSGALFGATAEEAFFVKIDDENNPPEMRDAGRLIIDIGVAPVKPAEFVIFRISQITQSA